MRNVNICFRDETYKKIKDLVERRKISRFVNEAVEEKIRHEEQESLIHKQKEKEELRKEMIAGYTTKFTKSFVENYLSKLNDVAIVNENKVIEDPFENEVVEQAPLVRRTERPADKMPVNIGQFEKQFFFFF